MKRKDITTEMVLNAYLEYNKNRCIGVFPYDILEKKTGANINVICSAIKRDYDRYYLECGVSIRTGWLTEKGYNYLKTLTNL